MITAQPTKIRTLKAAPAAPRKYWTTAECAAAIRAELKAEFPTVKFSVRKRHEGSISVDWTDGPNVQQVRGILGKYERGYFDGMRDIYEYDNRRDDIPQVDYILENREMSDWARDQIAADIANLYRVGPITFEQYTVTPEVIDGVRTYDMMHQAFAKMQIMPSAEYAKPCKTCGCMVNGKEDAFCGHCGAAAK